MSEQSEIPLLPPEEAIAFFRAKGLALSFDWRDVWEAEHARAFTVAKMMAVSLLEDTRAVVDAGLAEGQAYGTIAKALKGKLREAGWWGRQVQTDPATGEAKLVQLGSERRVRTIIETNLNTAYAVGRFERVQRVKSAFPIMVYKSRMDGRERDSHHDWHDTALPVDHPWWETHYPPCDWGCRCRTVSVTNGQADRRKLDVGLVPPAGKTRRYVNKRTGAVSQVEDGIGPGWAYHVGKSPSEGVMPSPIGGGVDGEALADAAGAQRAFLAHFGKGLDQGQFIDAAGWPLAIGAAWLAGLVLAEQGRAARAAAAIADPDSIALVWVIGNDGRAMLVRRYLKRLAPDRVAICDVGRVFWRFAIAPRRNRRRHADLHPLLIPVGLPCARARATKPAIDVPVCRDRCPVKALRSAA